MNQVIGGLLFVSQHSRWISSHLGVRRNILGYDRPGADDGALADGHAAEDGRAAANAGPALDDDRQYLPGIRNRKDRAASRSGAVIVLESRSDQVDATSAVSSSVSSAAL